MGVTKRKYTVPPRTAMEVYEMLPLGTLAEVINNTIYMSPAPSFEHQRVITYLSRLIDEFAAANKAGVTVVAPVDVYLDEKNIVQPDIVFLSNSSLKFVKAGKIKGTPDLIVEVLSPGNEKHDLEKKKAIYETFGVKEYFIVDPKSKAVITYYLVKNKFIKQTSVKGKINSKLLGVVFEF
jgi:Uma2 family endonuclease